MNRWRFLKRKSEPEETNQIEEKSKDTSIDFTNTMFSDIAEMKLKLENIKSEQEIYENLQSLIEDFEKYIEKSSELIEERKIEEKLQRINESNIILEINPNPEIPQSIKDRATQELTIEDYYKNIKAVYDVKYKKATQSILIRKLEKFNNDMDKLIFDENKLNSVNIKELNTYFEILKAKKEEFTGIMQNKYIERLIELEYKINIIEMVEGKKFNIHYITYSEERANYFINKAKSTNARQIIWSRLFIIGIQDFVKKSSNGYSEELKKELEKINLKDKREEILNSKLVGKYIDAIAKMQRDKETMQKEEEERAKKEQKEKVKKEQEEKEIQERKAELEQFKNLNPEEIENKIRELDDDKFDIVTSYKNIIDYQIKVAMAKGLINERNILKIDDIKIQRIEKQRIPVVLENLRDVTCNCEIYTDVDDSKRGIYIVTPKSIIMDLTEKSNIRESNNQYSSGYDKIEATQEFFSIFKKYISNTISVFYKSKYIFFYSEYKNAIEKEIKSVKKQWEKENKDSVNKIKFYIEMPYRRTIIPVLEELKQSDIEFTIPPIDKYTKMNNPVVRIYMAREDLEKYKEEVHKKISTPDKGIVKIGEEDIDIGELLIEGCDFPFLEGKSKNKEE